MNLMSYELVIMQDCIRSLNSEVMRYFDTANYFKVTFKSYTRLLLFDVYIKFLSKTNYKTDVTNMVSNIAHVFRLTRRSTQQRQRKEPALQPQLISKPSTGSNETRLISYRARNK